MNKGERISQFVQQLESESIDAGADPVVAHPYYRAFFRCWNEQLYYEAHDVLEQVWLGKPGADANFFKGLIQAAGGFVHLQKNFEQPTHPKHGKRLRPAVRLFRLALANLAPYQPRHHALNVTSLCELLERTAVATSSSNYHENPWSPERAPVLELRHGVR